MYINPSTPCPHCQIKEFKCEVIVKQVYGNDTVYPANATAEQFAKIAGTKTMTHALLCQIEALGIEIVDVTPRKSFGRAA